MTNKPIEKWSIPINSMKIQVKYACYRQCKCGWGAKSLGKMFSQFLKVKLSCYSAIPLQGDIEEELKHTYIKAVHVVLITELLTLENDYSWCLSVV